MPTDDIRQVSVVAGGAAATNAVKAEDAAHTSGDSGVFVLVVRQNDDDAAPAANGDYIALLTNAFGALRTIQQAPVTSYYEQVTGTAQVEIIAAPGAGTRLYLTSLRVQNEGTTASRVQIQEGAAIIAVVQLAASLGSGLDAQYTPPIRLATNTALNVTPGTSTTIGVSVTYYIAAE